MPDYTGELAALATAFCFACGSTFFTITGRVMGAQRMNRARLLLAGLLVMALHGLLLGRTFPQDVSVTTLGWLGLSGFVGLVAGDTFLMQAFVLVGPRLSMLVMALAPVFGTILAWLFLNESLSLQQLVGIGLAIAGVIGVVTDDSHNSGTHQITARDYRVGLLCALGGALGQAGGSVLSKFGLQDGFSPLSAALIRILTAVTILWVITALRGGVLDTFAPLRGKPHTRLFLLGGTIMGPVLGIWLSLIAVQRAEVGVASALIALTPIFLIPISHYVFKERITSQAVISTVIAVGGTILLFV